MRAGLIKPIWLKIPEEDFPTWTIGVVVTLACALLVGLWVQEALAVLPFVGVIGMIQRSSRKERSDGALIWDPPTEMRFDRRESISVYLGHTKAAVEELIADLKGSNQPVVLERSITPAMAVKLIGEPDFEIIERSNPDQYVELGETGQWDFYVTPKKRGSLTLRLLPSIRFLVDGREQAKDLKSYDHVVEVSTSPFVLVGELYKAHRKSVVTLLLIPFLIFIAKSAGWTDRAADQIRSWLG